MLSFILSYKDIKSISNFLDWACVMAYQGAIFFAQSQFFIDVAPDSLCRTMMPTTYNWLLIEIAAFYACIGSLAFFLLFSSFKNLKFNEAYLDLEMKKVQDYLIWSKNVYKYLGVYSMRFIVSIVVYILEKDVECPEGTTSYKPIMIVLITSGAFDVFCYYTNMFFLPPSQGEKANLRSISSIVTNC